MENKNPNGKSSSARAVEVDEGINLFANEGPLVSFEFVFLDYGMGTISKPFHYANSTTLHGTQTPISGGTGSNSGMS